MAECANRLPPPEDCLTKLRTGLGSLAPIALILSMVASASAAPVVPPENSAATQYTEAFPTAGGPKPTSHPGRERSPTQVLGRNGANRLEAHGEAGQAVAELVAQTAPATLGVPSGETGGNSQPSNERGRHPESKRSAVPAEAGAGQGSSGLAEVASQATGSSGSDGMGLLLPLTLLGAVVWAGAYWARQRRQSTA